MSAAHATRISSEDFSDKLDEIMIEHGLTEAELGMAIHKSRGTISNWRLRKNTPLQNPAKIIMAIERRISDDRFQDELRMVRSRSRKPRSIKSTSSQGSISKMQG